MAVAVLATSTVLIATEYCRSETNGQGRPGRGPRALSRKTSYFHRIALAHRELSADNLGRALELLDECPEDLREWEWHYLMRLCRVEPV